MINIDDLEITDKYKEEEKTHLILSPKSAA